MQSISSLSLAPAVIDWLANTRHPRILHVFDHACNLTNEHRDVLSVVTPQIGNGPFNLVIGDDVLFPNHLHGQSLISIDSDQLHLGDLIIHTADAKLWTSHPDWERLHAGKDRILGGLKSCIRSWNLAEADFHERRQDFSPQRTRSLSVCNLSQSGRDVQSFASAVWMIKSPRWS